VPNEKFQFLSPRLRRSLSFTRWQRLCVLGALAFTDGVDRVGHQVAQLSSRNNDILKNNNGILQLGRMGHAMPVLERNLVLVWCAENSSDKAHVELESRLTGRRANLAGGTLALGYAISHIPILEDTLRVL